eukprot:12013507-Ditylum_brightwellii.AAC.1
MKGKKSSVCKNKNKLLGNGTSTDQLSLSGKKMLESKHAYERFVAKANKSVFVASALTIKTASWRIA